MRFEDNEIVTMKNYKGIGIVENTTTFSDYQIVNVKWLDGNRGSYMLDQIISLTNQFIKLSRLENFNKISEVK